MPFSGMRYLDLMLGISSGKKLKNVGKFPLLSVDTFAGDGDDDGDDEERDPQILPTFPIFQVEKNQQRFQDSTKNAERESFGDETERGGK